MLMVRNLRKFHTYFLTIQRSFSIMGRTYQIVHEISSQIIPVWRSYYDRDSSINYVSFSKKVHIRNNLLMYHICTLLRIILKFFKRHQLLPNSFQQLIGITIFQFLFILLVYQGIVAGFGYIYFLRG